MYEYNIHYSEIPALSDRSMLSRYNVLTRQMKHETREPVVTLLPSLQKKNPPKKKPTEMNRDCGLL